MEKICEHANSKGAAVSSDYTVLQAEVLLIYKRTMVRIGHMIYHMADTHVASSCLHFAASIDVPTNLSLDEVG